MVIYEWKDVEYLGKVTDPTDDYLPVSQRQYINFCLLLTS